MTDHLIDRGAYRFRKTPVAQASRNGFLNINNMIVTDAIKLFGGYTRHHIIAYDNKIEVKASFAKTVKELTVFPQFFFI
jgi:hypothetical protein